MIRRDAEPIAHVPPRRRIDLYGPKSTLSPSWASDILDEMGQIALANINRREHERVWGLVRQTAERTNQPSGAEP